MGSIGAKGPKASRQLDRVGQLASARSTCLLTPKLDCLKGSRQGACMPSDRSGHTTGMTQACPPGEQRPETAGGRPVVANRSRTTGCSPLHLRDNKEPIWWGWSQATPGYLPSTDRQDFHQHAAT